MSEEPQTPDPTLVLRNIQGLCREMRAVGRGQIRMSDALDRLARRVEDLS